MDTPNTEQDELSALWARYHALAHAVQTGVEYTMHRTPKETEPKHLRVGVNLGLVNSSALAQLLMQKGLITEREYAEALVLGVEREVEGYRHKLAEIYGVDPSTIKLA